MKMQSLLTGFLIASIALPYAAFAQPSRRSLIQQGKQILEESKETKLSNFRAIGEIEYKRLDAPILGYSFEYPAEDWNPGGTEHDLSDQDEPRGNSYADVMVVEQNARAEQALIAVYATNKSKRATLTDAWEEWNEQKWQPDHDNTFEYYKRIFIRELVVQREEEAMFLGHPAILLEYTFSKHSKNWVSHVIMVPWGSKVYTIKYRAEDVVAEVFDDVWRNFLASFHFLTPDTEAKSAREPEVIFTDVPNSHPNAAAIGRLRGLGIIRGYADGSYKPDTTINRAEFVKIMTSEPLVPLAERERCNIGTIFFSRQNHIL